MCFRFRCICMAFVIAAGAIIWQNRQFLSTYTGFVLQPPAAEATTWCFIVSVLLQFRAGCVSRLVSALGSDTHSLDISSCQLQAAVSSQAVLSQCHKSSLVGNLLLLNCEHMLELNILLKNFFRFFLGTVALCMYNDKCLSIQNYHVWKEVFEIPVTLHLSPNSF